METNEENNRAVLSQCINQPMMVPHHRQYDEENAEEKDYDEVFDDRPFKCQHCSKGFRQKGHLVYHLHTHSETCDFQCDECEEAFMTPAKLLRHQRTAHWKMLHKVDLKHEFYIEWKGSRKSYTCKRCGKYFTHMSSARSHSWMHSGTRPYKCKYCDKDFRQSGHLICHVREFHSAASEDRIRKCCSKDFRTKQSCDYHIIQSHGYDMGAEQECDTWSGRNEITDVQNNDAPESRSLGLDADRGDERPKTYPHYATLPVSDVNVSKKALYKVENDNASPDNSELDCVNRIQPSATANGNREASDIDENSLVDSGTHCDAVKEIDDDFVGNETSVSILGNGLSFSYSPSLLSDKRNISIKYKPISNIRYYECTLCNKAFTHAQTAQNHSLMHAGIKPFRCNVCNMTFRQRSHVVYHMHRHTGLKHFGCNFCNKSFETATKLRRHGREVHKLDKNSLKTMMAPHVKFRQHLEPDSLVGGDVEKSQHNTASIDESAYSCKTVDDTTSKSLNEMSSSSLESANCASASTQISLNQNQDCSLNNGQSEAYPKIVSVESRAILDSINSKKNDNRVPQSEETDCNGIENMGGDKKTDEICEEDTSRYHHSPELSHHNSLDNEDTSTTFDSMELVGEPDLQKSNEHNFQSCSNDDLSHPCSKTGKSSTISHAKPKDYTKVSFLGTARPNGCRSTGNLDRCAETEQFICKPCCDELATSNSDESRCVLCGQILKQVFAVKKRSPQPSLQNQDTKIQRSSIGQRDDTENLYPCPFCSVIFRKRTDITLHIKAHKKPMAYCCVVCDTKTFSLDDFREHSKEHILLAQEDARKEVASLSNDIINKTELINIEECEFEVHIKAKNEDFYCSLCGEYLSHWLYAKKHALDHKHCDGH